MLTILDNGYIKFIFFIYFQIRDSFKPYELPLYCIFRELLPKSLIITRKHHKLCKDLISKVSFNTDKIFVMPLLKFRLRK